jgi:hypothetical protein
MKISKGIAILLCVLCCTVTILSGCSTIGIEKELYFREDILCPSTGQMYQIRIYNK